MVSYPLTGGLDLTSAKPLSKPGTLTECLNFEVSTLQGYSRIGGLARFDGSEAVGSYKVWRLRYTDSGTFTAGTQAWFDPALKGWVLSTAVQDGVNIVYLMVPGAHEAPGLPDDLTDGTSTVSILEREPVFDGYGTQENFNAGYASIEAGQISRISAVPGRTGSDIIGGFWFKDRLYVIRDLPRIAFEGGYYTDSDEGKYITIDSQEYKVLDVSVTGDGIGVLTYDTEVGSGTDAAPLGGATLTTLPVTGEYNAGYTGVSYFDDMDVSGGIAPYEWEIAGSVSSITPVDSVDANNIDFMVQTTNAALYRSGDNGWERVSLGRELQFKQGGTDLENFVRSAVLTGATVLDTGHVMCGTAKIDATPVSNLGADDTTTDSTGAGGYTVIEATNFDFSNVPENATIVGIEVKIDRAGDATDTIEDSMVILTGLENQSANKARGGVWANALSVITYGGEDDLWGSQEITGSVVRDATFGVKFIAKATNGSSMAGSVDYVSMKVWYVERDKNIYIWDGSTDVTMVLHHTQITSGTKSGGTAGGYMTVTAATNADKTRLVNNDDEIRTAPSGGGTLLAKVAARDKPIWLAGQAEIDVNRSRYQFEKYNFYGQDEFEAVYGVCGASPAFSFDGSRFVRIRTELPAEKDLPRHVTKHGDMLALGYFPGAVVFSKRGDPNEMRGSEGAVAVEVGDRLVALAPMAGDALGIVCQTRTEVIRGLVPADFQKSPISARRGGIEYTTVDMGRVVLCDGLGIFVADSPEQFGAAERSYVSTPVHPWLSPRLQAQANSESAHLRPVVAMNVRNKNQMRLYFWDGWMLTMTMTEPPQFTTQRYFEPAANEHSEPTPWVPRMIVSGIDSSGRERLFCSFYGGVKEGYVYEMDAGRSFDGDPIPAHIVMSPLTVAQTNRAKRYDTYHVYGSGHGWASLTASRYVDDADSNTGDFAFNMGKATASAKTRHCPLRGVVDSPVEAFDISLRFDSNTATEGLFTLQYITILADDRGTTRGKQGAGE